MNVLLVHSGNAVASSEDYTFVKEQGDALSRLGVSVFYYAVRSKGARGYLKSLPGLKEAIKAHDIDIVHAHYGLCGALAVLQRKNPVVITFHNGETLTKKGKLISSVAAWLCSHRIFVAQHIHDKLLPTPRRYDIIPCGIDLADFPVIGKDEARTAMSLPSDCPNILFGGSFSNARKNYPLAKAAVDQLPYRVNLIEMKGFDRKQVCQLLYGCDLFLLPTKSEGSPQAVKEALACNCPIVATGVADIPVLLDGVDNCYVTGFDAAEVASRIDAVLQCGRRSDGRKRIMELGLDNSLVAQRILEIYRKVLGQNNHSDRSKHGQD